MEAEKLTIGEVASRAGVNVETLRYYERRGLLKEPHRHPSGHRQYPPDAVDFIRSVKRAQALGFTLDEIEEFMLLSTRKPQISGDALSESATRKLGEIDAKIASLKEMRLGLETLIDQHCDSLTHCTCGRGCPVGPTAVTASVEAPLAVGKGPDRRLLGMVPLAVIACLACFLPAVIGGGLAVGSVPFLSILDAPADLALGIAGALAGVAGTLAVVAARQRQGTTGTC